MDPTQDRDSPEAVIRRYSDMVYRLAFARTGNRSDAEDLYQEVFLRYLTRAPAFTSEEHRKAWLLRVAANCAQDLFRAPWRKRERPIEEAEHLHVADHIPEPGGVLEAVLSLPESYRLPVHLFYYEGLSIREIAGVLGKREGAVRTSLTRARALLRDKLKEEGDYV